MAFWLESSALIVLTLKQPQYTEYTRQQNTQAIFQTHQTSQISLVLKIAIQIPHSLTRSLTAITLPKQPNVTCHLIIFLIG